MSWFSGGYQGLGIVRENGEVVVKEYKLQIIEEIVLKIYCTAWLLKLTILYCILQSCWESRSYMFSPQKLNGNYVAWWKCQLMLGRWSFCNIWMYQINMYTLNLHKVICQLYLSKAGQIAFHILDLCVFTSLNHKGKWLHKAAWVAIHPISAVYSVDFTWIAPRIAVSIAL